MLSLLFLHSDQSGGVFVFLEVSDLFVLISNKNQCLSVLFYIVCSGFLLVKLLQAVIIREEEWSLTISNDIDLLVMVRVPEQLPNTRAGAGSGKGRGGAPRRCPAS